MYSTSTAKTQAAKWNSVFCEKGLWLKSPWRCLAVEKLTHQLKTTHRHLKYIFYVWICCFVPCLALYVLIYCGDTLNTMNVFNLKKGEKRTFVLLPWWIKGVIKESTSISWKTNHINVTWSVITDQCSYCDSIFQSGCWTEAGLEHAVLLHYNCRDAMHATYSCVAIQDSKLLMHTWVGK